MVGFAPPSKRATASSQGEHRPQSNLKNWGRCQITSERIQLKRGGKVYARVIPDAKGDTLVPIIERKVVPDSIVYSDSWRGYNALDVSSFKHFRINHSILFADAHNHINGIENFWNQVKRHMRKFNGVPKEHFGLFLKECEWRFNNPDPKRQLSQLKQWVRDNMG